MLAPEHGCYVKLGSHQVAVPGRSCRFVLSGIVALSFSPSQLRWSPGVLGSSVLC